MANLVNNFLTKLFGTKSQRDLKTILPLVDKINQEWQKLTVASVSDDALRAKTQEVQQIINEKLKEIDQQIAALHERVETDNQLDVLEKEEVFAEIDRLEKDRNKRLEEVLMEVLPVAFAIVKETSRRLKENKKLEVNATFFDKLLASQRQGIEIQGEKAIWHNQWMAAGNLITWEMVHYDVQLIGGIVLHQGKIAEMATGEGKTLVATLPAFLNALAKRGVHIVTVNDYLARRDCEWMGPIFEFHGLAVDCIDRYEPHSPERIKAYQADITYGTNNEFGFDYLRDNMAHEMGDIVQRKHHYAMVDEVDSVLIDEARTPLIISGPVARGDEHEYQDLKPRIARIVEVQKKLVTDYLNEAKKKIKEGNEKEGGLPLFRAYRGLPKFKPLIKFLSEPGMKALLQKTENYYLQDNQRMMPEADKPLYFTIDEKNNQIDLTEKGIDYLTGEGEDPDFFILPDIATTLVQLENDASLSDLEKHQRKETLVKNYTLKSQRIHSCNQLLKAYSLFEKEVDYIIDEGKVKIVDEHTGRIMEGRRYSDGLHQALEAKENVKIEDATQTYATVTLQNYFRMYHKLAGMTGTAETEAGEFWNIYKLDVVVIPTNVTITRKDRNDLVFKTMREKYNAVVEEIISLTNQGRPVLVGTTSVEISELLSRMLNLKKIRHQVLNAKLHQKEAEIVAEAGKSGTVTIATNMAGRGTDIKLTKDSKEAGGLAIIGTERHESRRIDRQLRGRSGRQGDPGTSQFYVSLEDSLMRLFGSDRIARIMDRLGLKEGEVIQHSLITKSIERAQRKVEENNFAIRKNLLEYDNVMNVQRERIYEKRRHALSGERLQLDVLNTFFETCEELIGTYAGSENIENFTLAVFTLFGTDTKIKALELEKGNPEELTKQLYSEVIQSYERKNDFIIQKTLPFFQDAYAAKGSEIVEIVVPFTDGKRNFGVVANLKKVIDTQGKELIRAFERSVVLSVIDQEWKEHLREMDDLRQSVRTAYLEQKDPILVYKFEAFELFKQLVSKINQNTVTMLLNGELPIEKTEQVKEAQKNRKMPRQKLKENKAEAHSLTSDKMVGGNDSVMPSEIAEKVMPIKASKTINRNAKVTVQYNDGRIKKDVKFKTVEDDIKNNKCVVVN